MPALAPLHQHARLPYRPGLDGLRALAVAAVVLYHGVPTRLPGGFLGVEVFFVISGYLITSLLLAEHAETRRLNLRAFWARRARRLLPALVLLLVTLVVWCLFIRPGDLSSVKSDAILAMLYVSNWAQIIREQPYFEVFGSPPLLQHLWSLAIEEQFYVLWPPLLLVLLRLLPRRGVLVAVLFGAVASGAWMAVIYALHADPDRVYYGTDTRAAGLLIGAALAIAWPIHSAAGDAIGGAAARVRARGLDLLGLAAVVALLLMFARTSEHDPWLYQGGFGLCALLTATTIAVVARPSSLLGGAFSVAPMRWIGVRSYSIYLWHWPVYVLLTPATAGLSGAALLVLQLAVIGVLSEVSFRVVEVPFRRGALGRLWRWQRTRERRFARLSAESVAFAALVAVAFLAWTLRAEAPGEGPAYLRPSAPGVPATAPISVPAAIDSGARAVSRTDVSPASRSDDVVAAIEAGSRPRADESSPAADGAGLDRQTSESALLPAPESTAPPATVSGFVATPALDRDASAAPSASIPEPPAQPPASSTAATATTASGEDPPTVAEASPSPSDATPPSADARAAPPESPPGATVTAIGDSVMLGAVSELRAATGASVDAELGRQFASAVTVIERERDAGTLGEIVILHIGTNGPISDQNVDQVMKLLADRSLVVWVTLKVPRTYEEPSNDAIRAAVRYPNAAVVDWNQIAAEHDEYFWDDHVHLRPDGAEVYAHHIAEALDSPD